MTSEHTASGHTLVPPASAQDELDWLRLLRSRRVGPATFVRLMAEHGSAKTALEALPEVARAAGLASYAPCPESAAAAELRAGRSAGARLVGLGAADYPPALAAISDAPPLLWLIGDPGLLSRPCIALVGARNASSLGLRMARKLARELGEAGYVVVSGLARGIDAAAHGAALESGTVAVMAGGVDIVYPPQNAEIAAQIAARGLRVSEQPIGLQPQARHFPRRNRLVSGMSAAVVVIEAAAKSGSLITARQALDQGREVLAVPGHPFDARAGGANLLIREGATLVRTVADVVEALGAPERATSRTARDVLPAWPPAAGARAVALPTAELHALILDRLGPSPMAEDQLIRDLGIPAGRLAPELVTLELDGRIRRQAGGLLSLG